MHTSKTSKLEVSSHSVRSLSPYIEPFYGLIERTTAHRALRLAEQHRISPWAIRALVAFIGCLVLTFALVQAQAGDGVLYMHSGGGMRLAGDHAAFVARIQAGEHPKVLVRGWHGDLVGSCEAPEILPEGRVRCEVQIPCSITDPELNMGHQHLFAIDSLAGIEGTVLVPTRVGTAWQIWGMEPRPVRVQWLAP